MLFEQFRMERDGKFLHFLRSKLGQKDEIGHQTETQYQSPVISTSTSDKCCRTSQRKAQMMNKNKLHEKKNNKILKEGTELFNYQIKGMQQ